MLVLSRRLGEEILIDGNIRVSIAAIKKGQIRVGISAPESVKILRPEVLERFSGDGPAERNRPKLPRLRRRRISDIVTKERAITGPSATANVVGLDLVLEANYE